VVGVEGECGRDVLVRCAVVDVVGDVEDVDPVRLSGESPEIHSTSTTTRAAPKTGTTRNQERIRKAISLDLY
jgi:hypothetical protein